MSIAHDNFCIYRQKYDDAMAEYNTYSRLEEDYRIEKKQIDSNIKDTKKSKIDLEKRLSELVKLIAILEGTGRGISASAPDRIKDGQKKAAETAKNYSRCIVCTGIAAADINAKFSPESVYGNTHSLAALRELEGEKRRVENAIAQIDQQIKQLEMKLDTCKSNIKFCDRRQDAAWRDANFYWNEMDYWYYKAIGG